VLGYRGARVRARARARARVRARARARCDARRTKVRRSERCMVAAP
jgi:hypothetical protein